jgi:heat shock transcription factor, other eukaryote
MLTFRSFLDTSKNTELIRWSDDGNSFIVLDEDEFARTLIPELFKHNNYASFVRQLNMYGFHKKVGLSDNSMRASERKNKSPSEYSNPYFRRGHLDLLWLIQKPKNAATGKKGRKLDAEAVDEDVDEYVDEVAPVTGPTRPRPQLMLGQGDNTLNQEQMQSVQRELSAIRHQQAQISRMMAALKREHEQLYGQAATFQDQHNRHENSINAILTFLATVYNRSLQGHEGVQNIQNLFTNAIPHDTNQGTVIDVADYPGMDNINGDSSQPLKPFKRQPLLLTDGQQQGRASTMSPSSNGSPMLGRQTRRASQQPRQPGAVEELLDSAATTPQPAATSRNPQSDMMSVIQNTNRQNSSTPSNSADFSNVLSSLENADGQTPLTNAQRADMLRMMNSSGAASNKLPNDTTNDNALINSTPPSGPTNFNRALASTNADFDHLARLQADQDRSVEKLTNLLQPLSPSGSIPGLNDGTEIPNANLDIDSFLSGGNDYFNDFNPDANYDFGNDGTGTGGLDFGSYQDNDELFPDLKPQQQDVSNGQNNSNGMGLDGTEELEPGKVESLASSEVTTPRSVDQHGTGVQTRGMKRSSVDDDEEDGDWKRQRRSGRT